MIARFVVGKKRYLFWGIARCKEGTDRLHVFLGIVDTANNGDADPDVLARCEQFFEIFQDELVSDTRVGTVFFVVDAFYVIKEKVGEGKNFLKTLKRDVSRRIHSGVDIFCLALAEKLPQKIDLEHTFSAGKRDPTPGRFVKWGIAQGFRDDVLCGRLFSAKLPRAMEASKFGVVFKSFPTSATDTFIAEKHGLDLLILAFRIMTPGATEIATLEKDGRSDSGAIVGA